MQPNPVMYVNSAGQADPALRNVNNAYINDAIHKLRARASKSIGANIDTPRAAPAAPAVNDTTVAKPSIMDRVLGRAPLNPGNDARAAALRPAMPEPPPAPTPPPAPSAPAAPTAAAAEGAATQAPSFMKRALKGVGKVAAGTAVTGATIGAIADSAAPDATARYAERFGTTEPTGDGSMQDMLKFAALRAGGFASDLGNNLTGGLAGKLYRDQPGETPQPAQVAGGAPAAPGVAPAPGAPSTATPTQMDLSKMLDNPGYIPEPGTGIIRNDTTGRTQEVGGDVSPELKPAAAPAEGQAKVQLPDASLALNSGTMDDFLSQYSSAANTIVANNQANAADKRGIVGRKMRAEATKAETEASSAQRLDEIMGELTSLDDTSDPTGQRRFELRNLALTIGGHAPQQLTDTAEDRYLRALTKSTLNQYQDAGARDEAQQWIDQQMEAYRGRRGGGGDPQAKAGQFEEGKVYVDSKGNRAMYQGGKWVAA